jgi:hypothetical protein
VFALRMSNDRDQEIVRAAVSDTGSGMLEFLPSLGQREAIAFGDGVSLPVRIKFDELPKSALPRSSTARFSEKWQKPAGDDAFVQSVVDRWRASGSPHAVAEEIHEPFEPVAPTEQAQRRPSHGAPASGMQRPPAAPAAVRPAIPAAPHSQQPAGSATRRVLVTPPPAPAPEPAATGSAIRRSGLAATLLRRKD